MNRPRIGLIACRVFEEEIARHMPADSPVGPVRFFEVGLHDQPDRLREALQAGIDAFDAEDSIEAVALAYALCGLGTAGLKAGRHRLVIPRAHDCITVFMGCKKAFADHQAACPDAYYFTPGWMRESRTPGPARLEALRREFGEKFEPEDVEFLLESEQAAWAQHGRAVFLDLDTPGADACAAKAAADARSLGWSFERRPGDPSLLRDLLLGNWDDRRFQILEPGATLAHSPDSEIFRAKAAPPQASPATPPGP